MIRLSHRGICVSDLERSRAFYREVFGFVEANDPGELSGPEMDRTMELTGALVAAPMLALPGGPTIELLHFRSPEATGPREPRPFEPFGLHHLAFTVPDIDAAASRIASAGGRVLHDTLVTVTEADGAVRRMLYCTDPDGVRIQLLWFPGRGAGFSHSGICVSDVEASARYYEALGFSPADTWSSGEGSPWLERHTGTPGMHMTAHFLRDSAGNRLELLRIGSAPQDGERRRRPLNQFGLTHLAFWDDDPRSTVATLTERGGYFVERAHVVLEQVELHHGADPDGVRIELMTLTGRA